MASFTQVALSHRLGLAGAGLCAISIKASEVEARPNTDLKFEANFDFGSKLELVRYLRPRTLPDCPTTASAASIYFTLGGLQLANKDSFKYLGMVFTRTTAVHMLTPFMAGCRRISSLRRSTA